ncbi:MAG: TIGR01777 family oxidoreductase [Candidatus Spechtbacterales bacterium]|nr:TIGR01777 family oxidoreductase [Candidatus Spechtbacterales bacterium]
MKITITGGSGFIGLKLSKLFTDLGHEVLILDIRPPRKEIKGVKFVEANLLKEPVPPEAIECDAIVHLAGVNIFGRWTEDYKKLILESRTKTAKTLIDAIKASEHTPEVFVSASAIGYYGDGGEEKLDESAPSGNDFLANVCKRWEAVAQTSEDAGMRWVSVRTGIVLGPGGGMLGKLVPIFKMFLGGPLASGNQWFSWIHIEDLLNVYKKAVLDSNLSGPVNAVAPNPVRNKEFAKALGSAVNRPAIIPVPKFALKIVLGELANEITMSQRVIPKKIQETDFNYKYPDINSALKNL